MPETVLLVDYLAALRDAEEKFQAERDRRLTEVAVEREKALKIKETADLAALQLAREIQTYKDEKANELREQINRERNIYATKEDVANSSARLEAMIKPLLEFVAGQQTLSAGSVQSRTMMLTIIGLLIAAATVILIGTR